MEKSLVRRAEPGGRWAALDALRGLTLASMVVYHACWDLVYLFGVDWKWYRSAGAYLWQQSICWTFILLSGFCWPLGKRPLRRGLEVFAGGALVTLVTVTAMPESRVLFGVLTLLGSCMLLMVPLERALGRVPAGAGLAASGALFALLRDVNQGFLGFERLRLAPLPEGWYRSLATAYVGFPPAEFWSTDYFALLPWAFLFLCGYFLQKCSNGRRPEWDLRLPPLEWLGRRSLWVYLLHQPLVYGGLAGLNALGVL